MITYRILGFTRSLVCLFGHILGELFGAFTKKLTQVMRKSKKEKRGKNQRKETSQCMKEGVMEQPPPKANLWIS